MNEIKIESPIPLNQFFECIHLSTKGAIITKFELVNGFYWLHYSIPSKDLKKPDWTTNCATKIGKAF